MSDEQRIAEIRAQNSRGAVLSAEEARNHVTWLLAALERSQRETAALRAAFIKHRTATHEVKPKFCKTCRESDDAIAATATGSDAHE